MAGSERAGPSGAATGPSDGLPERMLRRLPDPTQAWAVLVVNADPYVPGRLNLAFTQRQLLKSQGCYLADRVLVALGEHELAVHQVLPLRLLGRRLATWRLGQLHLEPVLPVGAPGLWSPAVRLSREAERPDGRRVRRPVAELRPDGDDRRALDLLDQLEHVLGGANRRGG